MQGEACDQDKDADEEQPFCRSVNSTILGGARTATADNGNFLKEVELLGSFDAVMENHVTKISDERTRTHYLGQQTQNELIQIISTKVLQTIQTQFQEAKYFSIILECTPI